MGESYFEGVSWLEWGLKEDERCEVPGMLLISRALDVERETEPEPALSYMFEKEGPCCSCCCRCRCCSSGEQTIDEPGKPCAIRSGS